MSLRISDLVAAGVLEASTVKKTGGTASQFLKADGSVDATAYLNANEDSEQTVGGRVHYFNDGVKRMNVDPRWNESGYDADLGTLHIWAWTAGGAAYGRAGIALYNGSAYQYLTTKASTTGMFINNTQVVTNSGTWSINITGSSGTSSNSSQLSGYSLDGATSVATRIFNNKGQNHSTYTNFNTIMSPGPNYLQGAANGPTGTAGGQWYGFMLGLGQEYGTSTGSSGHYASQLYYSRISQESNQYLWARDMEGGAWGSWRKLYAGYADTAGALSNMNISQFTNNSGYLTAEADTLATVVARGGSTLGSITVGGNITVSSSNTTGGGIILADDGDIVDLNDAYLSLRFSSGVRIFSANRGGTPVITLQNNGVISATGAISASNISTGITASHIVQRDANGYIYANHVNFNTSESENPAISSFITSNGDGWSRKSSLAHAKNQIRGVADGTWGINISGSASQLGGYTLQNVVPYHSGSDFVDGTLVVTNINAAVTYGDSFVMEVTGKSYGSGPAPFALLLEGYIYSDTFINVGAISYGSWFPGPIKILNYNGNLAFWWPRGSYWNSFSVHVRDAGGGSSNRVTSVGNSTEPASAKKVSVSVIQSLNSNNYNSYAPTLTGGGASGTWGINITGNAATATSATDSTKLPLAGGTLTGNLLFSNSGTGKRGIQGTCGDNDFWFIGGGATASNAGFLEIATGDDGQSAGAAEPIYVSQYGPGDVLTGTLFRRATLLDASGNTSFPGSLSIGGSVSIAGNVALHAGNYSSYTLPRGGSWYGFNTPGSRWGGFAVSGGEIVFGDGLPTAGQMGILVDGAYLAGENNGFWSLPTDNNWNGRRGMYWDGSQLNFTTNGPVGRFSGLMVDCGAATGRSGGGYAPANLNIILTSSTAGSDGVCGIDFRSGNNYPSDGASIYYENSQTGSGEVSRLVFRVENDLNDSILMRAGYHVYNARTVDNASQGADNPVFRWQYLDSNRMTLDSSGNLVCNGDVTAYSDARIKTNVHTIENALDKTLRMRGVSYNRTDGNDVSTKIGVIAQEVLEVLPEVVKTNDKGTYSVAYGNMVGLFIEAIKEQQKQIEELKSKLNAVTK
jgi:hypothetical protein